MASASVSACGRPPGLGPADSDHLPVLDDDAADRRVVAARPQRPPAEPRSACVHMAPVGALTSQRLIVAGEFTQQLLEILGFAEIVVDRGEAHIGDIVKGPQRLHDELADAFGRRSRSRRGFRAAARCPIPCARSAPDRPAACAARSGSSACSLSRSNGTRRPDRLHDHQLAQLNALEGGEAAAAIRAMAAPPDGRAVLGGTAVLHLGFLFAAERTAHHSPRGLPGRLSPRLPVDREAVGQRQDLLLHRLLRP